MLLRYLGLSVLLSLWVLKAQDLKAPPRCSGPECAERVHIQERTPKRRARRTAEKQRADRHGLPKPYRRAERFRLPAYSPRHKAMERAEAFSPYNPKLRHQNRAERFGLRTPRSKHQSLAKAERFRPQTQGPKHQNRAERFRLQAQQRKPRTIARAEKLRPPLIPIPHHNRAEKHIYTPPALSHKKAAEKYTYTPPSVQHNARAERFGIGLPTLRHQPSPQKELYALPKPRHRRPSQNPCEPPPLSHSTQKWAEAYACAPKPIRRRRFEQRQTCQPPLLRHTLPPQKAYCYTPPIRHKAAPQSAYCYAPPLRHKNFDRYRCNVPMLRHRLSLDYEVPCDAQRRGIMTQTERFAHDLRYLFTNHRKHCEFQSAYSGVSIGEWVNTESYGRVPVAGVKMGWRVYIFAHYYDKKARPLRKPRLEKRKVWSLYQLEVWVPEPAKKAGKGRRYIKSLPGIEGFGELAGMQLVKKRLSPEETKRIQIEKLVRKRQIAWLVRAYPEERVRLPEWIRAYAGPKPPHLWPGIDYRLLEVWQ